MMLSDVWRVLADRARLGRPGSRLPLRTSVAGLGGSISWWPPAYSLLNLSYNHLRSAPKSTLELISVAVRMHSMQRPILF